MAIFGKEMQPRVEALLSALAESWKLDSRGELTSQNLEVFSTECCLVQLLNGNGTGLTDWEFQDVVIRSIRNLIKSGNVSSDRLIEQFEKERTRTTRLRRNKYYFSTRLYVKSPFEFWLPIELFGVRLVLCQHLPATLQSDRFFVSGHGDVDPHEPDHGIYCIGMVSARSGFAALDLAAEQIATILGLVNFWLNLHVGGSLHIGKAEVAAPLPNGGHIVLYKEDGSLERGAFSYYTHVNHRIKPIRPSAIDQLANISNILEPLATRKKSDQGFYKDVFRRYFDSINESDSDREIISLWTLAEYATFAEGRRSNVIADRLAVTWADRKVVSAICMAAGHRRNMVVHGAIRGVRLPEVAEQFRGLVEQYLWHSLATDVENVGHWRALVELLTSGADLRQVERALPLAKKLRK